MKCKNCRRDIPENSIFCCWCGEKQLKEKKKAIRVPTPKQLPSGQWNIYLRAEGQSITEPTAELCVAKAQAIRAGFVEAQQKAPGITLSQAMDGYIADHSNSLSPLTIRTYRGIQSNRFQSVMDKPLRSVENWQRVVNTEAETCAPRTLKNAWGFVRTVLNQNGIRPDVLLPKLPRSDRPWLTPEQIPLFLEAVRDEPCELVALLALHSLRRSEIAALRWGNVSGDVIRVRGALVPDEHNNMVYKTTTKTAASSRDVPVLIPRLSELLSESGDPDALVYTGHINTPYKQINDVCERAGLPAVGVHGLRHSFASICYHLKLGELEVMHLGGWSDYNTVHRIYTHLSSQAASEATEALKVFFKTGKK